MMRLFFFLLLVVMLCVTGCEEAPPAVPKPRTYPRIAFPEQVYERYTSADCPFSFEVPTYAQVEKDSIFFDERAPNDCWLNIFYPEFNGQLYCSYYPIRNTAQFDKLVDDSYYLASKHTVKADYIQESTVSSPDRVYGVIFEIDGATASGLQFFLTDSTSHFFKGSLYINTEINIDSLAPILTFLKKDVEHMINTFHWTKPQ